MAIDRDALQEGIHEALRGWHAPGAPPRTALDDLLLVQERREQLARDGNSLALRLATNHVLWDALEVLEHQDETGAQVLRWRFPDNNTLLRVAHRLNVSEHTVSRLQRGAIEQLALILEEQERGLRERRLQQLEARLPPPSYTRLFGIEEKRHQLTGILRQQNGPGVIAIVGIGGIGKTALADSAVRAVMQDLAFDNVIWVRYQPRTMSGESLSPEHALDTLLATLGEHLIPEGGASGSPERLAALRQRLKEAHHLVVVDNLESEAVADYLLNQLAGLAGPSKFLLTTRTRPHGQAAVRHVSLPELSQEDAGRLLRHHATDLGVTAAAQATDEDIGRVYAVTGGNPLALKLVVGLLDLLPLGEVLEQLARSPRGPVEDLYRHIYWQTWRTLGEPARTLLQAMPLVAESGGDAAYLQAISGLDANAFWPALQELRSRSLLEVRGTLEEKRYGIHRLTETFVRTEIIHWPEEAAEHDGAGSVG